MRFARAGRLCATRKTRELERSIRTRLREFRFASRAGNSRSRLFTIRASSLLGWHVVICALAAISCTREPTLFEALNPGRSGIDFVNTVEEDDVYNVMAFMNIYTGAGVAAGDVNNDGLCDLYFSGNQHSGRLYLNRGDLRFEDVTETAGLENDRWGTGVSMVDIDQDGWLDIYVNVSGIDAYGNTANLLYLNQGDGTFREAAAEYGIDDPRQTMQAVFFDHDGDLDLDLFLIVNPADLMVGGVNVIRERQLKGESPSTDVLYRNNGDGTFTDVSREAGIHSEGYSLSATVSDINRDGHPDIFVANDFLTNDVLYINQGDGTFRDEASTYFRHTSFASMGNDIADINNDGLVDLFVLDMLPEDNYRRKMIIPAANYNKLEMAISMGYDPQFTRNVLQLNNGNGSFSEVAWLAGLSSTDWSWSALLADYDNDADRDVMVTNGFYRDLGNLDYIKYQLSQQSPMGSPEARIAAKRKAIEDLEQVPLHDYLFENAGVLQFVDRSAEWGFTEPGFSNSACYADLDNDGDLDLVISRLNATAQVFENRTGELRNHHFLRLQLEAAPPNRQALGARIWLFADGNMQYHEHQIYRGYEGSMEPVAHFGLGSAKIVDSLIIRWPDGERQIYRQVGSDQTLTLVQGRSGSPYTGQDLLRRKAQNSLFHQDTGQASALAFSHRENPFVDFDVQPLLPHMHSRLGPGQAVGDLNGDGREDLVVGGAAGQSARIFFQDEEGRFEGKDLGIHPETEDMGMLLFDAEGDGDLDLYAASGGAAFPTGNLVYRDRLYLNQGNGRFTYDPEAFTPRQESSSCVVGGDYDGDGDLDLFVGSRVVPGQYPLSPTSRLLRNDSPPGGPARFTDLTEGSGIPFSELGMVSAALWTDFDADGRLDLIVTGEFMPLRLFRNNGAGFTEVTEAGGLSDSRGWWNSLIGGDFDADGDTDYLAGNLGLNTRFRTEADEPLSIYAADYDNNGTVDPVMAYYVQGENYIAHARDEMARQIPGIRNRFQTYGEYASAPFHESFLPSELSRAYVVRAQTFESSYFENLGGGKFRRKALPRQAQVAPVFGMQPGDFNRDGKLDVALVGNAYGVEPSHGPYDAFNGLVLLGDGTGAFETSASMESGFWADRDAKSLVRIHCPDHPDLLSVGNNDDSLQVFRIGIIAPEAFDQSAYSYALLEREEGKTERVEFYHGQGYLSQPSRYFLPTGKIKRIRFFSRDGQMVEELTW